MLRPWIITLAIVVGVAIWMLAGQLYQSKSDTTSALDAKTAPLPRVRTSVSSAAPMTNRLVLQGRTVAERTVQVSAETAGLVEAIAAERGATVEAGDLIVRLAKEGREAQLLEARSLRETRKVEYEAIKRLKASGYQAETELARARAALDGAEAAVELATLELSRIHIRAPIAGIINTRNVEIGDFVDRGNPVATVVDLDPIRIVGQVSERYLGQVDVGALGEVRLVDDRVVQGRVSYVGKVAANTTRTFPVEIEIPNPDGLIIEGLTAELSLPVTEVRAHRLPPSVLTLSDAGELGVKAIGEDTTVIFYPVTVLGDSPQGIWLGGLPEQLQLLTIGHEFVQAGQRVQPVPEQASVPSPADGGPVH